MFLILPHNCRSIIFIKISPPVHVPEDVKRIPNFKCRKDYQQGKTFFIVQSIVFFTIVKSPKVD